MEETLDSNMFLENSGTGKGMGTEKEVIWGLGGELSNKTILLLRLLASIMNSFFVCREFFYVLSLLLVKKRY
jgi:hypothetical protein